MLVRVSIAMYMHLASGLQSTHFSHNQRHLPDLPQMSFVTDTTQWSFSSPRKRSYRSYGGNCAGT
jgi:hypothetical protein